MSGKYESFPYARAWVNWMVTSSVKRVFFKKPSRISYTISVGAAWNCAITDRSRKICVWRPTDTSSDDFVKTEIDPLFNVVPKLREKLIGGTAKNNPSNTNRFKEFTDTVAYFFGGKTPNNYAAIGVSISILDELDRFTRNVGGEGSPVYLAWKRTEASVLRKLAAGSTPTLEGESQISDEYEKCDLKVSRYLPCPHCQHKHTLEWENFKFGRDSVGGTTAHFVCPGCNKVIEQKHYSMMDANGVWMADDGTWYDEDEDCFYSRSGKKIYEIESLGVYIWGAYSYLVTWVQIAREFLDANEAMKNGDESQMITFTNQVRALPYRMRSRAKTISIEDLKAGVEDYTSNTLPDRVAFLTAGMDVQSGEKSRVEIVVAGHSLDGKESWHVTRVVVDGELSNVTTQEDINYLLLGSYHTQDNRTLRIKCALIDEGDGNNVDYVRGYVNSLAHLEDKKNGQIRLIFRTYKGTDRGNYLHPYKQFKDRRTGIDTRCHFVNHITGKDMLFKAAREGRIHFNQECDEEYFKQFTSERRTSKRVNGILKVKYELRRPGIRAEVLDCWNMAQAAKELYFVIKW